MIEIKYSVVFDLLREGYTAWHLIWLPGLFCICGVVVCAKAIAAPDDQNASRTAIDPNAIQVFTGFVGAVLAGCAGMALLWYTGREYVELRRAVLEHHVVITEGQVTEFAAERADRHSPAEWFRVGDATFTYSAGDLTSAFHHTADQGGPVREGLAIRIGAVDGKIVRLEVGTSTAGH